MINDFVVFLLSWLNYISKHTKVGQDAIVITDQPDVGGKWKAQNKCALLTWTHQAKNREGKLESLMLYTKDCDESHLSYCVCHWRLLNIYLKGGTREGHYHDVVYDKRET